jgi:hypothetical protein
MDISFSLHDGGAAVLLPCALSGRKAKDVPDLPFRPAFKRRVAANLWKISEHFPA